MNRDITRADIRQLEVHARLSAAFALAEMCVDAWNGDEWAFSQCRLILRMGPIERMVFRCAHCGGVVYPTTQSNRRITQMNAPEIYIRTCTTCAEIFPTDEQYEMLHLSSELT